MKPLPLLTGILLSCTLYSQQTDTLRVFYKTGQYSLSGYDRQELDSFLSRNWDKLFINGYTDEVDDTTYNMVLSRKRAAEVYNYCINKKTDKNKITYRYFGETIPLGDNNTEEGKAINRRTEIIGYRFPRITVRPKIVQDPMKPVTAALDNGLLITYRPGMIPADMAANFAAGAGIDLSLVKNTTQMREYSLFNNTTNGEILSSVMIICPGQISPCKLDSPVLVRVPLLKTLPGCGIQKVKFFNTAIVDGKTIWEEQNKIVVPDTIDGIPYMQVWVDNFCGCVNFDIKIPECYDTDSTKLLYTKAEIKNLSAELKQLNSVYLPAMINDSTANLLFQKYGEEKALLSFSLYNGKRRVRSFGNLPLTSLPYDSAGGGYLIRPGTARFATPGVKLVFISLKVNKHRYYFYPEKAEAEIKYLKLKDEKILVDFMVDGPGKKFMIFKNQPIESIPFDEATGRRVINKDYIKLLKDKGSYAVER